MLQILFSFTPFMVCLCWFVIFLLHYHKSDSAKKLLTWFLATCVVLYFCHALFFTIGLSRFMESLWTLCSLSVYPLFFAYICQLVTRPISPKKFVMILLPSLMVAAWTYIYPCAEATIVRKLLNIVQITAVCFIGFRKLQAFDHEISNIYADTEGRNTVSFRNLLIAFVVISLCSAAANVIGRHYFLQSEWLLLAALLPFTILLFALSYIAFTRSFSMEQFVEDNKTEEKKADKMVENDKIGQCLELAVVDKRLYLTNNLTIGDVVKITGICRTNISTYINQTKGMSFSDYINRLRVEYAKTLLTDVRRPKIAVIAHMSGFSSEHSFYRNFTKFTGMTTSEWLAKHNALKC